MSAQRKRSQLGSRGLLFPSPRARLWTFHPRAPLPLPTFAMIPSRPIGGIRGVCPEHRKCHKGVTSRNSGISKSPLRLAVFGGGQGVGWAVDRGVGVAQVQYSGSQQKASKGDSLAVGEESRQASLAHCLTLSELVPQLRDRVTAITSLG